MLGWFGCKMQTYSYYPNLLPHWFSYNFIQTTELIVWQVLNFLKCFKELCRAVFQIFIYSKTLWPFPPKWRQALVNFSTGENYNFARDTKSTISHLLAKTLCHLHQEIGKVRQQRSVDELRKSVYFIGGNSVFICPYINSSTLCTIYYLHFCS